MVDSVFVDPPWATNPPKRSLAFAKDAAGRPRVVLTERADPGEADLVYAYEPGDAPSPPTPWTACSRSVVPGDRARLVPDARQVIATENGQTSTRLRMTMQDSVQAEPVDQDDFDVIDTASLQSFPASDPPAWATGQQPPRGTRGASA